MRRLGADLGVAGMSLNRYIPSREELLDAVAAQLVQESAPQAPPGAAGWEERLRLWASQIRRSRRGHPGAFTLMATRQGPLEGLRPPLTHPQWAEAFLAALLADGFSPEKAVAAYRRSASCLLGRLTAPLHQHTATSLPMRDPVPGRRRSRLLPTSRETSCLIDSVEPAARITGPGP